MGFLWVNESCMVPLTFAYQELNDQMLRISGHPLMLCGEGGRGSPLQLETVPGLINPIHMTKPAGGQPRPCSDFDFIGVGTRRKTFRTLDGRAYLAGDQA